MSLFKRRPDEEPDPDVALPTLDREQATRLVSLTRQAFAEKGIETTYDGEGSLHRDDGVRYGLHNLALLAARTPEKQWSDLARSHARAMVAADEDEPLTLEGVRDRLFLKLVAVDQLPVEPPSWAPEIAPGLVALPAVDHPTHVSTLSAEDALDDLGGFDVVRDVALGNLRRLRAEHTETLSPDSDAKDARIRVLAGDFFGASRLVVLDDVLRDELGVERPQHGVLVAVPNRHLLVLHVVEGPGVIAAVDLLLRLAHTEYARSPGPLSPHVYFAKDARIDQVTQPEENGVVTVDATGRFGEELKALGLTE